MKVLFTADWHIKLTSKQVPFQWQWDRYLALFSEIISALQFHDLLVIGGDLFDTEPNSDEIALFLEFYKMKATLCNDKRVLIYSGNHDLYSKRKESFLAKLLAPLPEVTYVDKPTYIYGLDVIPYQYIKQIDEIENNSKILLTHVRGDIQPHVKAEINLDYFNSWDLVLAGDLHDYSNSQRNILYPGSPVTTHYMKGLATKGYLSVDTETLEHKFVELELPQLIRKEIESEVNAVEDGFHHYEFIIKGSQQELAAVTSSKIKKKLTSVEKSDAKLNLTTTSTISEELELYFKEVLKFEETRVQKILQLFDRGLDA